MTLTQITEKGIKDGEIVNADINASAAIAGSKISPTFTSNVTISNNDPSILFTDGDANPDFKIRGNGGTLKFIDTTNNNADRMAINSDGHVDVYGNLDVGAGLDVTGTITSTGIAQFNNTINLNHASAGSNIIYFNEDLQFSKNGTGTRIKIDSTGTVGINSTSPLSTLHVKTPSTHNGTLRLGGSSADLGFLFEYDQASATTSKIYANPTYTNTGALLKIGVDGDANPNQLVLKGDGKIGIGTTSPSTLLHLSGGGNTALSINTGNNNGDNSTINFGDSADGNPGFINYDHGTNTLQFSVTGETMNLDSSGILGIGVVPQSGQYSGYNHLQIGESAIFSSNDTQADTNVTNVAQNVYLNANASAWKYLHTDEATLYQTHSGKHHFYTAPQGNQDNTVTFTERLSISSDGIKFNGDTATTNALSDYEEGSWTPDFEGRTSATPGTREGRYRKIGQQVFAYFHIDSSATITTTSGYINLSGLPFNTSSGHSVYGCSSAIHMNNSFTVGNQEAFLNMLAPPNNNKCNVYFNSGTNNAHMPASRMGTGNLLACVIYFTDS